MVNYRLAATRTAMIFILFSWIEDALTYLILGFSNILRIYNLKGEDFVLYNL